MKNAGLRAVPLGLCLLFFAAPGPSRADTGFGPGQSLDAKKALAEAREREVPAPILADAAPALEIKESSGWGTEFPVAEMSPYAAVFCKDGAGVSARATGEAGQFFKVTAPPFFSGGQVFTDIKFSIDDDFTVRLGPGLPALGRLRFETACAPWHTDREIRLYIPVALAESLDARISVRLDGACRSSSNWPNGPGRNYWRSTMIALSISDGGGPPHRIEAKGNWTFPDKASCEAGRSGVTES